MWDVEFYKTEKDDSPIVDFLDGLDIKMRAKALKEIDLLRELGQVIREPYSKHIQDGIYELRIKLASNISRMFYFFYVDNRIIITNGFIKKTQKTPKGEIERAARYKADYERRNKEDE